MLFHRDIGFPPDLDLKWEYTFDLKYSKHSLEASKNDKYGEIKLPQGVTFSRNRIVEIETEDNITIDKMVVRYPYALDNSLDLCLVIIPKNSLVKTAWLNKRDDKHPTLDKSKYEKVW